jgi:plasmid stabilization system protein ParE
VKYTTIIRSEAEEDLQKAFSWYEKNRLGLGYDFLLQVDAGLQFIQRNPEVHPAEYKGVRKHVLKRFPYKMIYRVETGNIIILAVLHGKRGPTVMKQRVTLL